MDFNVNILAVIITSCITFIIGMLWYSPVLFGNIWMSEIGYTKKYIEKAKK